MCIYIYIYVCIYAGNFSYIGINPKCGKTAHVFEGSPKMGRPRRARSPRMYRDVVSPIWEDSPTMRGLLYVGTGCSGCTGDWGCIPPLWGYTPISAVYIQPIEGYTSHNKWGYICFTSTEHRSSRCEENHT